MKNLIIQLINFKLLLDNSIYIDVQNVAKKMSNIKLSEHGVYLEDLLNQEFEEFPDLIKFAIIKEGYTKDFHIELTEENLETVKNITSELLKDKHIILPWVYGRELYDYYYENFETQEKSLDYNDSLNLTQSNHYGVYQIDHIIISSLGIIDSKEYRSIYPKLSMNLYHCSDPSCPQFHNVSFSSHDSEIFFEICDSLDLVTSEEDTISIDEYIQPPDDLNYYDEYNTESLPNLLFDSFSLNELKLILLHLLTTFQLRNFIPDFLNKGSNDAIVEALNKSEILALILIEKNNVIIECIEELLVNHELIINNIDSRVSNEPGYFGTHNSFLEFNNLGFRTKSYDLTSPIKKLKNLIKNIYIETSYKDQLEWRLRNISGGISIEDKLNIYLENSSPQEIVQNLIFSGPVQLKNTFQILPGYFTFPNDIDEESYICNKIIWKLGFNIIPYSKNLKDIWRYIDLFKDDVFASKIYNENDKEKIRSSAVNLFVSLEQKLQESLCFITWVLLSDHYLDTNFVYTYSKAKLVMFDTLNNYQYSEGEHLIIDRNGKNTLFPIITGFLCLSKICKVINDKKGDYERLQNEFPGFHGKNTLSEFPFPYKPLLLNLQQKDLDQVLQNLGRITSEFNKGNVLSVRNRLQHSREDYPTQDEISQTINSIVDVLTLIEESNFYPTTYRKIKTDIDQYNRTMFTLENYKGKKYKFYDYSEVGGSKISLPSTHNIIFENIFYPNTRYPLLFIYSEDSYYQNYWSNYPRKKLKKIAE